MIIVRLRGSMVKPLVTYGAVALTIIPRAAADSRSVTDPQDSYYLTQRRELLWMSLGIYLGILALSVIVGGLDKARGGVIKQLAVKSSRIVSLEANLRQSRDQAQELTQQNRQQNDQITRLEQRIDILRATVDRLNPFEIEANGLRPQIGPLQDTIRRKDEAIAALRQQLSDMTQERDRAGEQFTFVQQQIAEHHQQARELRAVSRRHGVFLCGKSLFGDALMDALHDASHNPLGHAPDDSPSGSSHYNMNNDTEASGGASDTTPIEGALGYKDPSAPLMHKLIFQRRAFLVRRGARRFQEFNQISSARKACHR
jgi:TolA-binding protein